MMKKVLVPFVAIVVGFGLFAACSNDSDSANSQVSAGYRTGNVTNYSGGMGKITHRYYIDVKGDEKTCTIKVTKYKAWNNENEATNVKVDDIYNYYWGPLFKSFENHFNPDEE